MNITETNCSRSALERFPLHCEQYVLARSVKDIAIHTDSSSLRGAKQRSNLGWLPVLARRDSTVAILAGFPSLRGAIAPWQSVRVSRHCEQSEAILSAGKDCFTPSGFAMTNTTSRPEECKHLSSLRGTSKTWQFIRTLRHCEEQSNEAILAAFKRQAQWRKKSLNLAKVNVRMVLHCLYWYHSKNVGNIKRRNE